MVLLEVTQSPPLEQAQHPPTVSARVARGAAVDLAVGVDAVGAHLQHPLGKAGLHPGDQNAALIGELVGGVDHGVEVDSRQVGVGRRERQGKHSFFTKSLKDGKTGRVVSIRPSGAWDGENPGGRRPGNKEGATVEQRQTAPAQDTERAVVDLETFERVWRRVMPNRDMSPIQVGAPTGPGTGVERQAERIPAPAQLQNQDQGAAPTAQIQSSAQLQPQSQVPARRSRPLGRSGSWRS